MPDGDPVEAVGRQGNRPLLPLPVGCAGEGLKEGGRRPLRGRDHFHPLVGDRHGSRKGRRLPRQARSDQGHCGCKTLLPRNLGDDNGEVDLLPCPAVKGEDVHVGGRFQRRVDGGGDRRVVYPPGTVGRDVRLLKEGLMGPDRGGDQSQPHQQQSDQNPKAYTKHPRVLMHRPSPTRGKSPPQRCSLWFSTEWL
jgi:hypothetical protein